MNELDVAIEAAALAAACTGGEWAQPEDVAAKGEHDFVTPTDRKVERLLIEHLRAAFPHHRILGEESASPPWKLREGTLWILDPICGTANFAFGIPLFCTNIFLMREGEPVLAVVAEGLRNDLVYAIRGQGTFLRTPGGSTTPLRGYRTRSTLVNFDSAYAQTERRMDFSAALLQELALRNHFMLREMGTSATLPMQARGVLAGNVFEDARPWDLSAGALLCEEAGHVVTAHDGTRWRPDGSGIVTGRDEATHAELLDCVRAAQQAAARSPRSLVAPPPARD
jgi:myo-inositol-1(or 4)-monophosphatase